MIKNIFINSKIKKSPENREHNTYENARRIGLLYNADEFGLAPIFELQMELEKDQKHLTKLGYIGNPPKAASKTNDQEFTRKDISSTGAINKDSITKFIEQPFDFLISLDTSGDINYKYILAASKAACKIGFHTEAYESHLMMFMKLTNDKVKSVNDLISYLKKI